MYLDASGLPRPLPHPNSWRRAGARRLVLKQFVGLDVERLPPSVQLLVEGPSRALREDERRRLVRGLVAEGLDARRLGLVLNVIGDGPASDQALADMVRVAQFERERATRPTENFTVLGISERAGSRGPHKNTTRFMLRVRLDEGERELTLDLGVDDLGTYLRFRRACIKQARFVPLFKEQIGGRGHGQRFDRFVDALLAPLRRSEDHKPSQR